MGWIGADLAALDGLTRRFVTTSEACQDHGRSVVTVATTTVERFATAMTTLERTARALSEDIGASILTLRTQSEATSWTGTNRTRQDELLAAYEADVTGLQGAIDAFLLDAAGIVGGSLNPTIEGLRNDVERAATATAGAADGFARRVEAQRRSFDAVLNGAL